GGLLGGMLQTPLRLTLFETAVLAQTAVVGVVERLPRRRHRGLGQEDRVAPRPLVPMMPRADPHGRDAVGVEIPAAVGAPRLRRPILVIGRQPGDAHHYRLQPLGPGGPALALASRRHPA